MKTLAEALRTHYGLEITRLTLLEGYENRTFRAEGPQGSWILKEHAPRTGLEQRLELEARMMRHFSASPLFSFPEVIPTMEGGDSFQKDTKTYRLLHFLEGTFLAETPQNSTLLESVGKLLGETARLACSFTPGPVAPEPFSWDLQHLSLSLAHVDSVADVRLRTLIRYFASQMEAEVLPHRYAMRRAMIHNDANDWNILVRGKKAAGLIDFGDACYSWLAADLAVGLTYALMDKDNPLEAAEAVLGGYATLFQLQEAEVDALYYLIGGRLCMSLCQSARAGSLHPDSEYISISEAGARRLLDQWVRISPRKAQACFRRALGLPVPEVPSAKGYARRRTEAFSSALSLSYQRPIVMERAAMQFMYGQDGATYLDAYNNIMLVGHCHPEVVRRGAGAQHKLNTNTRYHYDALLDYAEALLAHFPKPLSRVFFVNSGSAATDLALRLARYYTGKKKVMALEHGYHGNTTAAIAVSPYKHREGQSYPETLVLPLPKVFGSGLPDDGTAGNAFAREAITHLKAHDGEVAAFIAEPIVGCGGQVPLASGYLKALYPAIRTQGGLCISDEVQVGFGRLGAHFWGYEAHGVVPDMVILGKPMGNGHPIGAVVCSEEVAEAFARGPEFFSSFGGNPVSCAIGHAVLDVLKSEGLQDHARITGEYLAGRLRQLSLTVPYIADVRGQGMFLGVELLEADGAPATQRAKKAANALRESGVLIGTDGPYNSVLKIKPPLPFQQNNADELVEKLAAFFQKER